MNQRLIFLDYLRIPAIISVVLLHSFASTLFLFEPVSNLNWWIGNVIASVTHWAVPIFLMISGGLHLKKVDSKHFYVKKFSRIFLPLLAFTITYAFFYHFYRGDSLNLGLVLQRLIFDQPYEHLYFLVLLLIFFVLHPQLQRLTSNPHQFLYLYLVSVCFTLFFPSTRFIGLFWLPYLSYYLAGHVLIESRVQFSVKNLIIMLFISCVLTILGTALFTTHTLPNNDGFYFFSISSPLTIFISYSIFLLFRKYFHQSSRKSLSTKISNTVFGIYLIHPIFITLGESFFGNEDNHLYILHRILIFAFTLISSFLMSYSFESIRNSSGNRHLL